MNLSKILIARKTRNYTDLDAAEIAMAKKLGGGGSVDIVPFSTGTDEQVLAMIQAAHGGGFDLQTDGGWAVGDVRTITVSAFTADGNVSEPQQSIDIAISSFDEYMSCGNVLQFDFKDGLSAGVRMNSSGSNSGGYGSSRMKTVTLPALVNALPEWLKNSLIEFSCLASAGRSSSTIDTVTENKLALRSEVEILGTSSSSVAGEGAQIPFYTVSANHLKKRGHSGNAYYYWLRSPYYNSGTQFVMIGGTGAAAPNSANDNAPCVAPFGCL